MICKTCLVTHISDVQTSEQQTKTAFEKLYEKVCWAISTFTSIFVFSHLKVKENNVPSENNI